MQLRPFQETGVRFLLSGRNRLLADDMGLGKTVQAISAWSRLPEGTKLLVLCPSSVKYNWLSELEDWAGRKFKAFIVNAGEHLPALTPFDVVIANYDMATKPKVAGLLKAFCRSGDTVLVCDEAHKIKNPAAQRTKLVLKHNGGLRVLCSRVWLLTGTPVENRPMDLYPALSTLAPELLGNYQSWTNFGIRFCGGFRGQWGWDFSGSGNLDELADLLKGFMLRRKKEDVLDDLPDCLEKIVTLNTEVKADIHSLTLPEFRQELGLAKVEEAAAYIKEVVETGEKVVVFGYHRGVLTQLAWALEKYGSVLMLGGLTSTEKHDKILAFTNDDDKKVLVGQINSVGQGVDGFQKVARHVIFVELDWSPSVVQQAIDRCRRMGQSRDVVVHYLLTKHPFEHRLRTILKKKRAIIDSVIVSTNEKENLMVTSKDLLPVISKLNELAKALTDFAQGLDAPVAESAATAQDPKAIRKPKPAPKTEPKTEPKEAPKTEDAELAITDEAINDAAKAFVGTGPDAVENKKLAKQIIADFSNGGRAKDVPQERRADLIETLKAGPSAFQTEGDGEEEGF